MLYYNMNTQKHIFYIFNAQSVENNIQQTTFRNILILLKK